jgi:hypothetical protein
MAIALKASGGSPCLLRLRKLGSFFPLAEQRAARVFEVPPSYRRCNLGSNMGQSLEQSSIAIFIYNFRTPRPCCHGRDVGDLPRVKRALKWKAQRERPARMRLVMLLRGALRWLDCFRAGAIRDGTGAFNKTRAKVRRRFCGFVFHSPSFGELANRPLIIRDLRDNDQPSKHNYFRVPGI